MSNPVADSYVDASKPTRNFGSRTTFRSDQTPIRVSYLKFDVAGYGSSTTATLRFFAVNNHSVGVDVHTVADTSWGESTINSNNAPPVGAIVASSGPLIAGTWYSIDVSSAVTGDGLVTFALSTTSGTATKLGSRESATPPELHVPSPPPGIPPTPFVISQIDALTYQAESQSTPELFVGSLKDIVEDAADRLGQTGGGTITFEAGVFDLGSDWFEFFSIEDIVFEGQGIDVTTIQNNSAAITDTEVFDVVGAERVTIRDMTVSSGGPDRSTSDGIDFDLGNDTLIERVKINESRGRGIVFDGKVVGQSADRNTIRDCEIDGIPSDGIELLASSDNLIEGCAITNVGGHGIQITKSSSIASDPNRKSNNNVLQNNTIDQAGRDGINIVSSDGNQVLANLVTNSANVTAGRDGIRVAESNGITCDDNIVMNNVATDDQTVKTQKYGLNIRSSSCNRTYVEGNDLTGNLIGQIFDGGTDTTIVVAQDTDPPSVPTNLATGVISHFEVDLSWDASSDNVGVDSYTIRRDGIVVASVGGATLTYLDSTATPDTTHNYTVEAFDAAGNGSGESTPVPATTPPSPSAFTLNPVADAYVHESKPTRNYGSSSTLRTDGSPDVRAYLKFDVQGVVGTVASATLRVYANSSSSIGHDVRSVADTSWTEGALTFATAPALGAVTNSSGAFSGGAYIDVDVTSLITGNGLLSLAVTTTHTTAISYQSREGANDPELVIQLAP